MTNDTAQNSKRDRKKKNAFKKLAKSKDELISSAGDIWQSLKTIAACKKEEVTEKLIAKIKEEIEKVEKKK